MNPRRDPATVIASMTSISAMMLQLRPGDALHVHPSRMIEMRGTGNDIRVRYDWVRELNVVSRNV